ncbi:MAG: LptA/OstA family protein [Armatimonadota bacterium]|nr:LptA/OstA family protein [Armatimonadota bacterium]
MRRWVLALLVAVMALAPHAAAQQPVPPPEGERGRLRAERVRYDARNGVFEARGNVRLELGDTTITCQVLTYHERDRVAWAEGNVEVVQKGTTLRAPVVKYEANPRITYASGGAVVVQEDLELRSQDLKYRHQDEVVFADGAVQLTTRNGRLEAPSLWADLKNKLAEARGPAKLVRKGGAPPRGREGDRVLAALAKEDTTITSRGPMKYAWLRTEEATAQESVRLEQVDKDARAERITYSESEDRIELAGSVRLHQRSGQWLVRERLVRPPRDEEERKALETPAVLEADRVVIVLSTRNSTATGNVRVTQEGRRATGDRAEYDDQEGRIVLSGPRVRLEREDGSWLEAERVVVSLREDTFEAHGAVDTTFPVRR